MPGSTLLLAPGKYMGPFEIRVEVRIVGEGGVVLDSTDGVGGATLGVCCAGRVVLQSLDVRKTAGAPDTLALSVVSGQVLSLPHSIISFCRPSLPSGTDRCLFQLES